MQKGLILSLVLLCLFVGLVVPVRAEALPDPFGQKECFDEAKRFFQAAKMSLDRMGNMPDQLGKAVYFSGFKDGGLAIGFSLIVLYLFFLQPKKAT